MNSVSNSGKPQSSNSVDLSAAIRASAVDGKLSCEQAFSIARQAAISPQRVGEKANELNLRLSRCQLGLFGYPEKQGWSLLDRDNLQIPEGLVDAIQNAKTVTPSGGEMPCFTCWRIAETYAVSRLLIGFVVDSLGIKIRHCQLGAFK